MNVMEIKYEIEEKTNCFICVSHGLGHGYPVIKRGNKQHHISRYIYQLMYGRIPDNMHIHHKCKNRMCINVGHLTAINSGKHHSEHKKGESHHGAKLIEIQIAEIRADKEHTQKWLGEKYGVKQQQISRIKTHKRWKCVI